MCNCSGLSYCFSNVVYILERLASCIAATSVITCMVTTLFIMLGVGVGLGYNYCFVDMQTGRNRNEDLYPSLEPVTGHPTTSKTGSIVMRTNTTEQPNTTSSTTREPIKIARTMVARTIIAPLYAGIDFNVLIDKIKEQRENVTLELIV